MIETNHAIFHRFPVGMGFLPKDGLRVDINEERLSLGCGQTGLNDQDERAWNYDDAGRWRGPAPIRTVPFNLRAVGAGITSGALFNGSGFFSASGVPITFLWSVLEGEMVTESVSTWRVVIQSTETGAVVLDALAFANRYDLPYGLPNGNYLIGVRLSIAEQSFRLPEGYTRNDARYSYGDAPSQYWDYARNVGKLPPPGHEFYDRRAEILEANLQEHNPEDADYLVGADPVGGEWSAVFFHAGSASPPIVVDNFIPVWGASLYKITGLNTRTPIPVDPLARSGDKLKVLTGSRLHLAGQRVTASGLVTALWEADTGAEDLLFTLLGVNENPSTGLCECALANHGPTEILERPDGVVKVLTKCSKLKYEPSGARIEDRLPGSPLETGGHPGGQSLRYWNGQELHTTENFSVTNFLDTSGAARAQFYDVLVIEGQYGQRRGPGTVFHGRDDMALYMGRLWGVIQDKPFSDESAKQHVAWYDGADWVLDTPTQFPARFFSWQRLKGFESEEGYFLVAFGKKTQNEERLIGVGNGRSFEWSEFPFAIRSVSQTLKATGDGYSLLMPGREVVNGAIAPDWLLIEADPVLDEGLDAPPPRPTDWGTEDGGGIVVQRYEATPESAIFAIQAREHSGALLPFLDSVTPIWLRVDKEDLSPGDVETYTQAVEYGIWSPLTTPARRCVDVLYYVPPGADPNTFTPQCFVRNSGSIEP